MNRPSESWAECLAEFPTIHRLIERKQLMFRTPRDPLIMANLNWLTWQKDLQKRNTIYWRLSIRIRMKPRGIMLREWDIYSTQVCIRWMLLKPLPQRKRTTSIYPSNFSINRSIWVTLKKVPCSNYLEDRGWRKSTPSFCKSCLIPTLRFQLMFVSKIKKIAF